MKATTRPFRIAGALVFILTACSPRCAISATANQESAYERALLATAIARAIKANSGVSIENSHSRVVTFVQNPFTQGIEAPTTAELKAGLLALDPNVPNEHSAASALFAAGTGDAGGNGWFPSSSALVSGLRKFVIARAEDELALSFLTTIDAALADTSLVRAALPRSNALLKRVNAESFQSIVPVLRDAAMGDLDQLPITVASDSFLARTNWATDKRDAAQILGVFYKCALEIEHGSAIGTAVASFTTVDRATLSNDRIRFGFHLLGRLAVEYSVCKWSSLSELLNQPDGRRYFLAFVVHDEARADEWIGASWLADAVTKLAARTDAASIMLRDIEGLRESVKQLATSGDGERTGRVLAVARSTLQAAKGARGLLADDPADGRVADALASGIDALGFISDKNYGGLVNWFIAAAPGSLTDTELKTLLFASNIASAKDETDVRVALQNASAPVGSFRSKRAPIGRSWGRKTVSIGAYPGIALGDEETDGLVGGEERGTALGIGIPVGLEFGVGAPWGSISVFLPVVDFGTLASTRLKADAVDTAAQIGWKQILAPGACLVIGISRRFPLSIGTGIQYVQGLRTNSDTGEDVNVIRYMTFVGLDATLFRF